MTNVFLMHRGVDRNKLMGIKGLIDSFPSYSAIYDQEDIRHEGKAAIEKYLRNLLDQCSIALLVVGNDSHNGRYLDYELSLTRNWNKKRCAVRLTGTTGGLPSEWNNLGIFIYNSDKQSVLNALTNAK